MTKPNSPNRRPIGLALMVVGVLLASWLAIDGTMWKRGGSRRYIKASLLQIKQCDAGPMPCTGVFNDKVLGGSRWFNGFRWALLASLAMIVLGVAAWGTNRLSPDSNFPDPSVNSTVLLFGEIMALAIVLMFFTPKGWSLGSGYYLFLVACGAVVGGGFLVGVSFVGDKPHTSDQATAVIDHPNQPSEPVAVPVETSSETAEGPACVKCGGKTAYQAQHKRYRCLDCRLYQPTAPTQS